MNEKNPISLIIDQAIFKQPVSKAKMTNFLKKTNKNFSEKPIQQFYKFKYGNFGLSEFISLNLLIKNFSKKDFNARLFVEIHPFLTFIEHRNIYQHLHQTMLPIKNQTSKNSSLIISSQNFKESTTISDFTLNLRLGQKMTNGLKIQLFSLSPKEEQNEYKYHNSNGSIKNGIQSIDLLTTHSNDMEIFTLFHIKKSEFEVSFKSNETLLNTINKKNSKKVEFLFEVKKKLFDENTNLVFKELFKSISQNSMIEYDRKNIIEPLLDCIGNIIISPEKKSHFIESVFSLSSKNSIITNNFCTFLWNCILFKFEGDFFESIKFFKSLNKNFINEFLEINISVFSVDLIFRINCQSINDFIARFIESTLVYENVISMIKIEKQLKNDSQLIDFVDEQKYTMKELDKYVKKLVGIDSNVIHDEPIIRNSRVKINSFLIVKDQIQEKIEENGTIKISDIGRIKKEITQSQSQQSFQQISKENEDLSNKSSKNQEKVFIDIKDEYKPSGNEGSLNIKNDKTSILSFSQNDLNLNKNLYETAQKITTFLRKRKSNSYIGNFSYIYGMNYYEKLKTKMSEDFSFYLKKSGKKFSEIDKKENEIKKNNDVSKNIENEQTNQVQRKSSDNISAFAVHPRIDELQRAIVSKNSNASDKNKPIDSLFENKKLSSENKSIQNLKNEHNLNDNTKNKEIDRSVFSDMTFGSKSNSNSKNSHFKGILDKNIRLSDFLFKSTKYFLLIKRFFKINHIRLRPNLSTFLHFALNTYQKNYLKSDNLLNHVRRRMTTLSNIVKIDEEKGRRQSILTGDRNILRQKVLNRMKFAVATHFIQSNLDLIKDWIESQFRSKKVSIVQNLMQHDSNNKIIDPSNIKQYNMNNLVQNATLIKIQHTVEKRKPKIIKAVHSNIVKNFSSTLRSQTVLLDKNTYETLFYGKTENSLNSNTNSSEFRNYKHPTSQISAVKKPLKVNKLSDESSIDVEIGISDLKKKVIDVNFQKRTNSENLKNLNITPKQSDYSHKNFFDEKNDEKANFNPSFENNQYFDPSNINKFSLENENQEKFIDYKKQITFQSSLSKNINAEASVFNINYFEEKKEKEDFESFGIEEISTFMQQDLSKTKKIKFGKGSNDFGMAIESVEDYEFKINHELGRINYVKNLLVAKPFELHSPFRV